MLPLLIVLFGSQTSALMHCFLLLPAVGWAGSFTGPRDNASNQAMQPTAGRHTASLHIMKTRPLQAAPALASGG
jgi:hypothetical protein